MWKEEASFESCAVPGLFASNIFLYFLMLMVPSWLWPPKRKGPNISNHSTRKGRFHLSVLQIYIFVGEGLGFWERSCSSRAGPGTVFGTQFSLSASPLSASFFLCASSLQSSFFLASNLPGVTRSHLSSWTSPNYFSTLWFLEWSAPFSHYFKIKVKGTGRKEFKLLLCCPFGQLGKRKRNKNK